MIKARLQLAKLFRNRFYLTVLCRSNRRTSFVFVLALCPRRSGFQQPVRSGNTHYGFRLDSSVDFLLGGESGTGYRLLSPESVSLFFCLRAARIARRSQGMLPGYLTVSSLVNTRVIWPLLPVFCWHCSSLALITGVQLLFCRFHFFSRP